MPPTASSISASAFKNPATAGWRDRGPEAETEEADDDNPHGKGESEGSAAVAAVEQKIRTLIDDKESGDLNDLTGIEATLLVEISSFLKNKRLDFKPAQWRLIARQIETKCRELKSSGRKIAGLDDNADYQGVNSPNAVDANAMKAFALTDISQAENFVKFLGTFLMLSTPLISQVMAVGRWVYTAHSVYTLRSASNSLDGIRAVLSTSAASQLVILCAAPVARRQLRDETTNLASRTLHLITAFIDITNVATTIVGGATAIHSIFLDIMLTKYLTERMDTANEAIANIELPPKPGTKPFSIETFKDFPVLACFLTPPSDLLEQHSTSSEGRARRAELAINEKGATAKLWFVQGLTGRAATKLAEKYAQKRRALVLEDMKMADQSLMKGETFLPIDVDKWIELPKGTALDDPQMIARFKAFIKLSGIAQQLRDGYPIHLLGPKDSGWEDKGDFITRLAKHSLGV